MPKVNRTSTADFTLFRREAEHWLKEFGLHDWRVTFTHQRLTRKFSEISYTFASRKARIVLATDFGDDPITAEQIKDSALHEVVHLLLSDLSGFAEGSASRVRVDEAEHACLHRIIRAVRVTGGHK